MVSCLSAVSRAPRHERAIELHGVEGEPRHRRKIRIAGSKIVHREAYAQLPEQAYSLAHDIRIAHRDRLGDLDLEVWRREVGLANGCDDILDEQRVLDFRRRD